jgi:hypothetical protein
VPLYEIINPSDQCSVAADEDAVAAVAVLLLGDGFYGCQRDDGTSLHTLIAFAGPGALDAVLADLGIADLADYLVATSPAIATCLESLMYCGLGDRRALETVFEDFTDEARTEAVRRYNDERRTSMSNIGARAAAIAARLREKHAATVRQQEIIDG